MIFSFANYRRTLRQFVLHPGQGWKIGLLLAAVLAYGSTGFLYWELPNNPELRWSDGLWYSIVTMTTVGYGDLFPKSAGGRFLVGVPLMLFGISLLGYALSAAAAAFVTSRTKEAQGMSTHRCTDHILILNFPGLAKVERVVEELRSDPAIGASTRFVLVDEHLPELPAELATRDILYVRGDPSRDETLRRANAAAARHAVILSLKPGEVQSDHRNVAIALALEAHHRGIQTVVECVDPNSEELLRKTGCDRIVCSARFDATFLSQELLNPGAQEVVGELMSSLQGQNIYITPLPAGCALADVSALATRCRERGHLLLGLRRGGANQLNPPASSALAAGDAAITIGEARLSFA